MSHVLRRPLLNRFRLPPFLRDLPAAVLIASMVLSLAAALPIFCLWVCPLKLTTEFLGQGAERVAREIVFVSVGIVALVAFPLLAKKRAFCGLICPFGAWQSLVGGLHPFRVTISPDRCTACGLCIDACPTMVLSDKSLAVKKIPAYCNACGECVDACPVGAASFTLWGRGLPNHPGLLGELLDVRVLVLFTGLLVGGSLGGAMVARIFSR
jgi:ferredoxin